MGATPFFPIYIYSIDADFVGVNKPAIQAFYFMFFLLFSYFISFDSKFKLKNVFVCRVLELCVECFVNITKRIVNYDLASDNF